MILIKNFLFSNYYNSLILLNLSLLIPNNSEIVPTGDE